MIEKADKAEISKARVAFAQPSPGTAFSFANIIGNNDAGSVLANCILAIISDDASVPKIDYKTLLVDLIRMVHPLEARMGGRLDHKLPSEAQAKEMTTELLVTKFVAWLQEYMNHDKTDSQEFAKFLQDMAAYLSETHGVHITPGTPELVMAQLITFLASCVGSLTALMNVNVLASQILDQITRHLSLNVTEYLLEKCPALGSTPECEMAVRGLQNWLEASKSTGAEIHALLSQDAPFRPAYGAIQNCLDLLLLDAPKKHEASTSAVLLGLIITGGLVERLSKASQAVKDLIEKKRPNNIEGTIPILQEILVDPLKYFKDMPSEERANLVSLLQTVVSSYGVGLTSLGVSGGTRTSINKDNVEDIIARDLERKRASRNLYIEQWAILMRHLLGDMRKLASTVVDAAQVPEIIIPLSGFLQKLSRLPQNQGTLLGDAWSNANSVFDYSQIPLGNATLAELKACRLALEELLAMKDVPSSTKHVLEDFQYHIRSFWAAVDGDVLETRMRQNSTTKPPRDMLTSFHRLRTVTTKGGAHGKNVVVLEGHHGSKGSTPGSKEGHRPGKYLEIDVKDINMQNIVDLAVLERAYNNLEDEPMFGGRSGRSGKSRPAASSHALDNFGPPTAEEIEGVIMNFSAPYYVISPEELAKLARASDYDPDDLIGGGPGETYNRLAGVIDHIPKAVRISHMPKGAQHPLLKVLKPGHVARRFVYMYGDDWGKALANKRASERKAILEEIRRAQRELEALEAKRQKENPNVPMVDAFKDVLAAATAPLELTTGIEDQIDDRTLLEEMSEEAQVDDQYKPFEVSSHPGSATPSEIALERKHRDSSRAELYKVREDGASSSASREEQKRIQAERAEIERQQHEEREQMSRLSREDREALEFLAHEGSVTPQPSSPLERPGTRLSEGEYDRICERLAEIREAMLHLDANNPDHRLIIMEYLREQQDLINRLDANAEHGLEIDAISMASLTYSLPDSGVSFEEIEGTAQEIARRRMLAAGYVDGLDETVESGTTEEWTVVPFEKQTSVVGAGAKKRKKAKASPDAELPEEKTPEETLEESADALLQNEAVDWASFDVALTGGHRAMSSLQAGANTLLTALSSGTLLNLKRSQMHESLEEQHHNNIIANGHAFVAFNVSAKEQMNANMIVGTTPERLRMMHKHSDVVCEHAQQIMALILTHHKEQQDLLRNTDLNEYMNSKTLITSNFPQKTREDAILDDLRNIMTLTPTYSQTTMRGRTAVPTLMAPHLRRRGLELLEHCAASANGSYACLEVSHPQVPNFGLLVGSRFMQSYMNLTESAIFMPLADLITRTEKLHSNTPSHNLATTLTAILSNLHVFVKGVFTHELGFGPYVRLLVPGVMRGFYWLHPRVFALPPRAGFPPDIHNILVNDMLQLPLFTGMPLQQIYVNGLYGSQFVNLAPHGNLLIATNPGGQQRHVAHDLLVNNAADYVNLIGIQFGQEVTRGRRNESEEPLYSRGWTSVDQCVFGHPQFKEAIALQVEILANIFLYINAINLQQCSLCVFGRVPLSREETPVQNFLMQLTLGGKRKAPRKQKKGIRGGAAKEAGKDEALAFLKTEITKADIKYMQENRPRIPEGLYDVCFRAPETAVFLKKDFKDWPAVYHELAMLVGELKIRHLLERAHDPERRAAMKGGSAKEEEIPDKAVAILSFELMCIAQLLVFLSNEMHAASRSGGEIRYYLLMPVKGNKTEPFLHLVNALILLQAHRTAHAHPEHSLFREEHIKQIINIAKGCEPGASFAKFAQNIIADASFSFVGVGSLTEALAPLVNGTTMMAAPAPEKMATIIQTLLHRVPRLRMSAGPTNPLTSNATANAMFGNGGSLLTESAATDLLSRRHVAAASALSESLSSLITMNPHYCNEVYKQGIAHFLNAIHPTKTLPYSQRMLEAYTTIMNNEHLQGDFITRELLSTVHDFVMDRYFIITTIYHLAFLTSFGTYEPLFAACMRPLNRRAPHHFPDLGHWLAAMPNKAWSHVNEGMLIALLADWPVYCIEMAFEQGAHPQGGHSIDPNLTNYADSIAEFIQAGLTHLGVIQAQILREDAKLAWRTFYPVSTFGHVIMSLLASLSDADSFIGFKLLETTNDGCVATLAPLMDSLYRGLSIFDELEKLSCDALSKEAKEDMQSLHSPVPNIQQARKLWAHLSNACEGIVVPVHQLVADELTNTLRETYGHEEAFINRRGAQLVRGPALNKPYAELVLSGIIQPTFIQQTSHQSIMMPMKDEIFRSIFQSGNITQHNNETVFDFSNCAMIELHTLSSSDKESGLAFPGADASLVALVGNLLNLALMTCVKTTTSLDHICQPAYSVLGRAVTTAAANPCFPNFLQIAVPLECYIKAGFKGAPSHFINVSLLDYVPVEDVSAEVGGNFIADIRNLQPGQGFDFFRYGWHDGSVIPESIRYLYNLYTQKQLPDRNIMRPVEYHHGPQDMETELLDYYLASAASLLIMAETIESRAFHLKHSMRAAGPGNMQFPDDVGPTYLKSAVNVNNRVAPNQLEAPVVQPWNSMMARWESACDETMTLAQECRHVAQIILAFEPPRPPLIVTAPHNATHKSARPHPILTTLALAAGELIPIHPPTTSLASDTGMIVLPAKEPSDPPISSQEVITHKLGALPAFQHAQDFRTATLQLHNHHIKICQMLTSLMSRAQNMLNNGLIVYGVPDQQPDPAIDLHAARRLIAPLPARFGPELAPHAVIYPYGIQNYAISIFDFAHAAMQPLQDRSALDGISSWDQLLHRLNQLHPSINQQQHPLQYAELIAQIKDLFVFLRRLWTMLAPLPPAPGVQGAAPGALFHAVYSVGINVGSTSAAVIPLPPGTHLLVLFEAMPAPEMIFALDEEIMALSGFITEHKAWVNLLNHLGPDGVRSLNAAMYSNNLLPLQRLSFTAAPKRLHHRHTSSEHIACHQILPGHKNAQYNAMLRAGISAIIQDLVKAANPESSGGSASGTLLTLEAIREVFKESNLLAANMDLAHEVWRVIAEGTVLAMRFRNALATTRLAGVLGARPKPGDHSRFISSFDITDAYAGCIKFEHNSLYMINHHPEITYEAKKALMSLVITKYGLNVFTPARLFSNVMYDAPMAGMVATYKNLIKSFYVQSGELAPEVSVFLRMAMEPASLIEPEDFWAYGFPIIQGWSRLTAGPLRPFHITFGYDMTLLGIFDGNCNKPERFDWNCWTVYVAPVRAMHINAEGECVAFDIPEHGVMSGQLAALAYSFFNTVYVRVMIANRLQEIINATMLTQKGLVSRTLADDLNTALHPVTSALLP